LILSQAISAAKDSRSIRVPILYYNLSAGIRSSFEDPALSGTPESISQLYSTSGGRIGGRVYSILHPTGYCDHCAYPSYVHTSNLFMSAWVTAITGTPQFRVISVATSSPTFLCSTFAATAASIPKILRNDDHCQTRRISRI
jgi:hypothetical protein